MHKKVDLYNVLMPFQTPEQYSHDDFTPMTPLPVENHQTPLSTILRSEHMSSTNHLVFILHDKSSLADLLTSSFCQLCWFNNFVVQRRLVPKDAAADARGSVCPARSPRCLHSISRCKESPKPSYPSSMLLCLHYISTLTLIYSYCNFSCLLSLWLFFVRPSLDS